MIVSKFLKMKTRFIFVLFASAALFSGCATSPVGPAKKAGITAAKIEPRVNSEALRFGMIQEGSLNAALAGLILDSMESKQLTDVTALMHDNGIDVPQMVRERFALALKSEPGLVLDEKQANGTFVLSIRQHGFDSPGFGISKKIPFVVVDAQLQNGQGNRIWHNEAGNNLFISHGMGATWSEYKADPARLKKDWEAQIDAVIGMLLCLK
jgi:hypothetical protein